MKYYIITVEDARTLGLLEYRQGNVEKGYLVSSSDIIFHDEIMKRAREVTHSEATEFVNNL